MIYIIAIGTVIILTTIILIYLGLGIPGIYAGSGLGGTGG